MLQQVLLSVFIFALVPLVIKQTSATVITICLFRLSVTVIVLSIFWRQKISFKTYFSFSRSRARLWVIGIIFFLHWITYAYAVKIGGAGVAVLGMSTYGLQLMIASALFLGHRITKKDLFCLGLAFVGLFLIFPTWNLHHATTKGLLLGLVSATCFALLPILHKFSDDISTEMRIFAQFFGAFLCFLFLAGEAEWNLTHSDWWGLLFLAIFGTLLAHGLWAKISSTLSPGITGLAYYSIAPMTIILSAIFMGERMTLLQITGAFIVIGAAVFNKWSTR